MVEICGRVPAPKPPQTRRKYFKLYLLLMLMYFSIQEHRNLPWRRLLMSKPAWACGIAVVGSQWADATLMLGVTKYLKLVYGFSIEYVSI